jgi:hypothetical protein
MIYWENPAGSPRFLNVVIICDHIWSLLIIISFGITDVASIMIKYETVNNNIYHIRYHSYKISI